MRMWRTDSCPLQCARVLTAKKPVGHQCVAANAMCGQQRGHDDLLKPSFEKCVGFRTLYLIKCNLLLVSVAQSCCHFKLIALRKANLTSWPGMSKGVMSAEGALPARSLPAIPMWLGTQQSVKERSLFIKRLDECFARSTRRCFGTWRLHIACRQLRESV